jgi:hypothetical protein
VGFLDKVKDKAQEAIEKGQGVAKEQQLKHELKKLEADLDAAYEAYGRAAFGLSEAGTLSSTDLATEAQAIRDAQTARDVKHAEMEAIGEHDGPDETTPPAPIAE